MGGDVQHRPRRGGMSGGLEHIVARWEWRTFGPRLGTAEARLAAMEPTQVRDSDEIYILALGREASIKARDGVMDVKRLEHVNADGLEQWLPVVKATYPLRAEGIREAIGALGAEIPPLQRDEYTLEQFLDEVVGPSPQLMAIAVHKHRVHYTVDGCMTERSEVRTDHGTAQTIAIESEDPARVVATVLALGLELQPNVSLPRELKTLAGFDAHRFATIDVGTNSVKFHLGERCADGSWSTIDDRAEITRLGEGLDASGRLQDEPVRRTVAAIVEMAAEAERAGAEGIAAVGTAGLRMAPNRDALVEAVRAQCGVEVTVISGEDESRLAYAAAVSALGPAEGSSVVFDSGGGSTQFTFGHGEAVDERFSVDVGAVRVTERFGLDEPVDDATLAAALEAVAADLGVLDGRPPPDRVVGMGGAVTNLTAVMLGLEHYDPDEVQGAVLPATEVERQIELYRRRTAEQRRAIVGLQPARAEVILAGACVVRTVLRKLGRDALTVSDRGLRHGLLVERFGQRVP
jgi:exopolyphosphatase/guanosine-5'-triphosphate,3'-diphosphate pyrophosphatase